MEYISFRLKKVSEKQIREPYKVPFPKEEVLVMDITFIITIFLIGFIGSYISGMQELAARLLNTQCCYIFRLY